VEKIPSGIYMILNRLNGKRYIGSAVNLEGRRKRHFRNLRNGKNGNSHLQNAYDKYGGDAFGWEVLKYVEDPEKLIPWEDIYLGVYWPTGLLYNKCPVAGSLLGIKREKESKETCRKKSEAAFKRWSGGEPNPMLGRHHSAETKQKKREIALKNWADEEYVQRQHDTNPMLWNTKRGEQNHNYGRHASAEAKKKMKEAALKRRMAGERNPMYGRKHSAKTKHKISVALKKSWARRKHAEHLLVLAQLIKILQMRLGRLTAAA